MTGVSTNRLPTKFEGLEERITNSILMTGGSCFYPGMGERLEAGIRMIRPCGTSIRILLASYPILDAWRGAAAYVAAIQFPQQTFSRMDYYEKPLNLPNSNCCARDANESWSCKNCLS